MTYLGLTSITSGLTKMLKLYTPLMFIAAAGLREAFLDLDDVTIVKGARQLARDLIDLTGNTPSPVDFQYICLDMLVLLTGRRRVEMIAHSAILGDFIYNAMCTVTNEVNADITSFQPQG
jgi:hypothetical protein